MGNPQSMEHHFERVASVYSHVRNTDPGIVESIISSLQMQVNEPPIDVADIACGTGRYSKIIATQLDSNLRLFCCDSSNEMLSECQNRMSREFPSRQTHYCLTSATHLPFANGCLDLVTTFNAIHHFDLDRFSTEAARILRPGGLLSIYTRTPEQNARTLWGQHFPDFTKRETRLYRRKQLEATINELSELHLEDIQEFKNVRVESVNSLLNRARNFHYSTFALYPTDEEFLQALHTFDKKLTALRNDGTIKHTAENTLVLARRI